jgi:hypothetical protein
MPQGGNRRGLAAPLDMESFEGDEYELLGWDMLSPQKDRLWILKQCKKYITGSHITRLWYCVDMDAIRGWLTRWKFRMTTCAIPEFALRYIEVIWWTKGGQDLPTCTYSNLTMVYAEVMLGRRVNWTSMTAHSHSHIITETIDMPSNVDWNGGSCTMP